MLGEMPGSGALLIGDKGTIFSPDDYGEQFFVKLNGEKKYHAFHEKPGRGGDSAGHSTQSIQGRQRSSAASGMDCGHQGEQAGGRAIRALPSARQLTEIMLLGCVSLRVGKKIEWDGPNMRATQLPGGRPVHQTRTTARPGHCHSDRCQGHGFGPAKLISMKCKTCDGEMIQKSRIRLAMVGIVMLASWRSHLSSLTFGCPPSFWHSPEPISWCGRLSAGDVGVATAKSSISFNPTLSPPNSAD